MTNRPHHRIPATAQVPLLVAMTLVAYLPALRCGFVWDDDLHVTGNAALRSLEGLIGIWAPWRHATPQYYPLTFSVFWLGYHLWGLNPVGYHLLNILLHAANAVLLWRLFRRLGLRAAWPAAALFAVHPVHVMSVAWITELKNVLCLFFLLLALPAWLRFAERRRAAQPAGRFYVAALLLFTCALLTKTAAAIFPAAVLLIHWWQNGRLRLKALRPLLPFLLLAVAGGLITICIEQGVVGARADDFNPSWSQRVAIAGHGFWFYLWKLNWPFNLSFLYPRWSLAPGLAPYLYPLATLALLVLLWKKQARLGRGPFAAMLYFTLAGPALVLVHVLYMMRYTLVSDHWIYFASPAWLLLAAEGGRHLFRRAPWSGRAFTALLLLLLAGLTWRQCGMYRNTETLWHQTLARYPDTWMAQNNIGVLYADRGQDAKAESHYLAALRARPDYPNAYNNLGILYQAQGRLDRARAALEEALRIDPDFLQAHYNLGRLLDDLGETAAAEEHYRVVAAAQPAFLPARTKLAANLLRQGRTAEAVAAYRDLLELAPRNAVLHSNYGVALARQGRAHEAITHLEKALVLDPTLADAHNNLANIYAQSGRLRQAVEHFQTAATLAPDDANIHYNLGLALRDAGDPAAAAAALARALELRPGWAAASNALATIRTPPGAEPHSSGPLENSTHRPLQPAPRPL